MRARAKVCPLRISAMRTIVPRRPSTRQATPRPRCAQVTRTGRFVPERCAATAGALPPEGAAAIAGTVVGATGAAATLPASATAPKDCAQYIAGAPAAPTPVARNSGRSMFSRCSGDASHASTTAWAVA